MTQSNRAAAIIFAALTTVVQSAYAQQPPDVVNSDNSGNTAMGTEALWALNVIGGGGSNTAAGNFALYSNTTGENNTGIGTGVLYFNTTGTFNTALGSYSLWWNANGHYNTATGTQVLYGVAPSGAYPNGSTGSNNTGTGAFALYSYSSGSNNTANGLSALYSNTTGNNNTANGSDALDSNTTGSNNLAEGYQAGSKLTAGSNNIDIGNQGAASDNNTIRIGTQGIQTRTQIAGIYDSKLDRGLPVLIDSAGQLGTVSWERFKRLLGEREHEREDVTQKLDALKTQSENQLAEIRDLKKLVVEMQAGLLKLQSKDELLAQR
jgi:hypothetical protein